MNQKIIIIVGIAVTVIWIILGVFSIIQMLFVSILAPVTIGIAALLINYEKGKIVVGTTPINPPLVIEEKEQSPIPKTNAKLESVTSGSLLLPDINDIVSLRIDEELLNKLYDDALSRAKKIFTDAEFSYFVIQVLPYWSTHKINLYFHFYSKWADRICMIIWSDGVSPPLRHSEPDKKVTSDKERSVFMKLPWKNSPLFLQALKMSYDKIKPLSSVEGTYYHLTAYADATWRISFNDGFNGNEYSFSWNGKGLDENAIVLM